jgi:hypothetical protein
LKLSVLKPRHPERVCWGCDKYCSADDLGCANGTERTPHPIELFGEDWLEWSQANAAQSAAGASPDASAPSLDPSVVFAPVDWINDSRGGDERLPSRAPPRSARPGQLAQERG